MSPRTKITVDGRQAETIPQLAARYDLKPTSMRSVLDRAGAEPADRIDARTPVYWVADVAAIMRDRPGKGANLRKAAQ